MKLYPPNPEGVPSSLTAPTTAYRLRVVLVLFSLFLFVALYVGLVVASGWLVYRTAIIGPFSRGAWGVLLWLGLVIACGMLFAFLLKGFFKRRRMNRANLIEIQASDQPELFAFIEQLCTDTGAPRPKRVFLSPDVNAAVFYDSSFLSLFLPVRKNLLIGLGLVNVLTLDELKAVLAHEFGHFSQSTMRIGSYVYVASAVMEDMIYGRDKWDELLVTWQRQDFRLAIFGWILGGVVWLLRKVLALVFMGIHLVNAALTRQMEFHADSVAVSVSGSDSLIRALCRLVFADQSLAFAGGELTHAGDHGYFTDNLFLHQSAASEHLRQTKGDPTLGMPPDLPDDPSQTSSVFDGSTADAAPSMWATHPPNHEREQSAKRLYIRSHIDPRPAWVLFRDPAAVQREMTSRLYHIGAMMQSAPLKPAADVQAFIDAEHAATVVDPRWKGAYDERNPIFSDLDAALAEAPPSDPRGMIAEQLDSHCETLAKQQKELNHDFDTLARALQQGGGFSFRGSKFKGHQAEKLLQGVMDEGDSLSRKWEAFDLCMLRAHRALAGEREAELIARYRFYDSMQKLGGLARRAMQIVENGIQQLSVTEPSEQEVQAGFDAIEQGWDTLAQALDQASEIQLIALPNMDQHESLRAFLLGRALPVRELIEVRNLDGLWFQQFFGAASEVADKLNRLQRKTWSSILRLHAECADVTTA